MGIVSGLGRIAQLVQSACLTRRMSGVRIPLRPFTPAPSSAAIVGPVGPFLRGGCRMYLFRLVTLAALSGALTVPLAAQGIPRNAARSTVNMAPRFMVANPFAFAPGDSAPAVAIGTGIR